MATSTSNGNARQTALWKRLAVVAASFGAGFAVVLSLVIGAVTWHRSRPKPWDTTAIKATFDRLGTEGSGQTLVFYYIVENATPFDYRVENKSDILITGKLGEEKAIGPDYEYATLTYPVFIPAKRRVQIGIHVPYPFEDECAKQLREAGSKPQQENHRVVYPSGTATIEFLASQVRAKYRACETREDRELVGEVVRIYPEYLEWLKPEERQKVSSLYSPGQKELAAFVRQEMSNLDGFVLLDTTRRYEIVFPKAW